MFEDKLRSDSVRLLSIREVAEKLSLSRYTIWRYLREGRLTMLPVRVGKRRVAFREDEINRYIESLPRGTGKAFYVRRAA